MPAPTDVTDTSVIGSTDSADGCSTATRAALPEAASEPEDDTNEPQTRRSARARATVDYALPSLRTKLRRGDRYTFGEAMRRRQPGRTKPPRRNPAPDT